MCHPGGEKRQPGGQEDPWESLASPESGEEHVPRRKMWPAASSVALRAISKLTLGKVKKKKKQENQNCRPAEMDQVDEWPAAS